MVPAVALAAHPDESAVRVAFGALEPDRGKACAVDLVLHFHSGDFAEGGKKVHSHAELITATGLDGSGPDDAGGDANAAFPMVLLAPAKLSVEGAVRDGASVVGGKDDEGVLGDAQFLDRVEELAISWSMCSTKATLVAGFLSS